jgi:hypothetical protein
MRPDVVAATMKVNSIFIGSDKLGHFFQQGYQYFEKYKEGASELETEEFGEKLENEEYGLGNNSAFGSGVFSFADLEANRQGLEFYKELNKNPHLTFDINKYVNDQWNEEINKNLYHQEIAPTVWGNLLRGIWKGKMNSAPSYKAQDFYLSLAPGGETADKVLNGKKYKTSKLIGGYSYTDNKNKNTTGTLIGTIVYSEHSKYKAVESIWLEFEWQNQNDKTKGNGILRSEGESILSGNFDLNSFGNLRLTKS